MKHIAIGVIVVATLAAGGLGTSYYVGGRIEQATKQQLEEITTNSKGFLKAEVLEFKRGITRSHAKTRWNVFVYDKSFQVTLKHDISQGPWAGGKAAKIISTIEFSEKINKKIREIFKGKEPLTDTMFVDWNGASTNNLTSPPIKNIFEDQNLLVTWGGMEARAENSAENKQSKGFLSIPQIIIEEKAKNSFKTIDFKNINATFDYKKHQIYPFWIGPLEYKISEITWKGDSKNFGRVENFIMKANSDIKYDLINTTSNIFISKLELTNKNFENIFIDSEIKNIGARWFDQFQSFTGAHIGNPEAQVQAFVNGLPTLLENRPEISISRLEFTTPDGVVNFSARAAFAGNNPAAPNYAKDLQGNIRIEASQKLLYEQLLAKAKDKIQGYSSDYPQDESSFEQEASNQAEQQINQLIEQGIIQKNAEAFFAELDAKDGRLFLNSQEISPMQLLGLFTML